MHQRFSKNNARAVKKEKKKKKEELINNAAGNCREQRGKQSRVMLAYT